jgi:HemY protein
MIRLIVFLVVAVALALAAAWVADHPGRVDLVWDGVQIGTSVAVLLIAVLLFGVLVAIVFEILRLLRAAPRRIGRSRRHARRESGYQALSQGMVAAAAGDVTTAKHLTRRAEKLLNGAPSTLLLSAQTAQLEGDEGSARVKFQEMLHHRETEFLGLRGLLAQAIKEGDDEGALRLARQAYQRRPRTGWVLTTLFDLQTRAGRWNDAMTTVGDMARAKLIDRETATRRRAILFHQQAAEERAKGRPQEALRLAQKAHGMLPSLAPITVQAAEMAEQVDKPRPARKMLETSWKARPHPALAKAYLALVKDASPAERFKTVQRLYALQPNQLEGELALAEAAIAAKQWQPARAALERALRLEPTASVYRLLAELEQADGGDSEKARAWLAKAVDAPPDPAWICESTGEVRAGWSPFGPDGRFDSLRWGSPPKIVPLLREGAAAELIPPPPAGGRGDGAMVTAGTRPVPAPTTTVPVVTEPQTSRQGARAATTA